MKSFAWLILAMIFFPTLMMAQDIDALRAEREKLTTRGMWRDVVTLYREKLMPVSDNGSALDLGRAVQALRQLNAWGEFDGLVEESVAVHPDNVGLLTFAATAYHSAPHAGQLVAGEFQRSDSGGYYPTRRGRTPDTGEGEASAGNFVRTDYRDQIRAMQLLRQAAGKAADPSLATAAWREMAGAMTRRELWKLQTLTPLDSLPEWGEPGPEGGTEGAPWSGDGPVLFAEPASWEAAKNDGERWRFALDEQARLSPQDSTPARVVFERAGFSSAQFGTETLASYGWWRQRDPESLKGILEVDTLAEDECLAKTSDGVRRFKLAPEFHFIALYRSIFNDKAMGGNAGDALVQVFLNRLQFDKARETLEQTIARHGPGNNDSRKKLLRQITGNWGRFDAPETVPAGTHPGVPLVFRNATSITLTAAPVDMEALLRDTMDFLKSGPRELDWQRTNLSGIAQRLIQENGGKYIGKTEKEWEVKLTPEEKHRTTRQEIEVPLEKSGAWWISGKLTDGNSFHALAWIVDSALVQRDVGGKKQWWVAEAGSGAPVAGAEIQFFGYRTVYLERKKPGERNIDVRTKEFSRTADEDGKTLLKPGDWDQEYQWLAMARKEGKATAFFGFMPFSVSEPQLENGNRDLTYGISDRPLYKPGDTVHLKFYLRNVGYFEPEESRWANKTGTLVLHDGRGEESMKVEKLKTDALGAVEAEVVIPKNAVLGVWNATFVVGDEISASVSLSVEEYRKPEYEVKVEAPDAPVKLGDKFTATVKATYFHGAPVRNAEVEIIVKRSTLGERWFPVWRWDWLYGKGAWWNSSEASWHPSWDRWGCIPPAPPWWQGNRWTPDELVMKRTVAIGPDGTAKVEVDTATAKQTQGDTDSKYSIEARVVDASRREERATGQVIAARKPFEVIVWTDRGYTRAGEKVEATVAASTLAGKPVIGAKGTLRVFELVSGDGGKIGEKEVQSFPVETDSEGRIKQAFAAPATGQYRLAASLAVNGGEAAEGAVILNVHGPGRTDPAAWHFGPLELIADKTGYAPGETARIRVNSDKENANVWMFLHIAGPSGTEARRIQLDGKSLEIEVPLDARDMPNMFIEGVTVHRAKVHTAVKQILLPPVSNLIEVALEPAKNRVKPRESSTLGVTLKDADGKPFTGIAVLAIYDKALEAITGGPSVVPIHENFWSWKNEYYPAWAASSMPASVGGLNRPKEEGMSPLGYFGEMKSRSALGGAGGARSRDVRYKAEDSFNGVGEAMGLADIAPASAAAPMERSMMKAEQAGRADLLSSVDSAWNLGGAGGGGGGDNPILVRKDFADLLKWSGSIQTDADGHAEIPLEFPDNLTTWKARVWVLGKGTRVGEGSTEIITSKDLLVRLQAPRFLVERDESVLSAVIQNDHDAPKTVKVSLEMDGGFLQVMEGGEKSVEIAARSEARVDWRVKAIREGEATLRMKADAGDDGDAVERKLPVVVHGMSRQDAWSRVVEEGVESAHIAMEVPEQRRPDQSKLTVRYSPTIAGAVVDAIPYLAGYPHGCTEQTLNRFVPSVIAQKMLRDLKINLGEVKSKRANLNPQELGNSAERAAQWKQWKENPVFDEVEIGKMVETGVQKLMSMQNSDGGWGWFSGYSESSYPHTTAVVVHGLLVARENGAKIPDGMLNPGITWLQAYEKKQVAALQLHVERQALRDQNKKVKEDDRYEKWTTDSLDAFVRLVLGEAKRDSEPMLAFLYRDRVELPVYAKCLLGLEQHRKGDEARRDEVIRMISQFMKRDEENQTAYLDLQNKNYWWNWYGSEVEAHAWYLKLLAAVKPKDADTRGLVKYLVNNRKHATYWESTRDTAFAIEAIASYFKASGEDAPEMEVEVLMDGKSLRKISISRENLFTHDGTVTLEGDAVTTGKHDIEIRRTGKGTLYTNAYLEVFTLEDKLRAAGLEVKVARRISKLVPLEKENEVPDATGLVVKQKVERFRREPLEDGAKIVSGDRVEVELVLESKNDYEYLLFSDAKAAGFEAVEALSGYIGGSGLNAYMEPRDKTVDFFIRALPRGTSTLRYQLRAEAPGIFKALPAVASAMYAPELRGNSEDLKLEIADRPAGNHE